ncbi:MAG TPA: phage tail tip lysozyme [Ensifer sp.]|nr:phage tail tip lysozyme [Ensifer sp.]
MADINPKSFANHCVTVGAMYGASAHYVMAVALLRSQLKDDAKDGKAGPYAWTQAEWDGNPDRQNPALGSSYEPDEISDWRAQVSVFTLMTVRQFTALQLKLGQNPSALQLYLAQWPEEGDVLVGNLQKACDDTRQAILDALDKQFPDPAQAAAQAIDGPKSPLPPQSSMPPASLKTRLQRNQWIAYHAALGAGLGDPAARAMVANLSGESLSNPADVHFDVSHIARGIVQWDPGRSDAIKAHFGRYPNEMSVEDQTRAAIWEIQSNSAYKETRDALFVPGKSVEDMIEVLVRNYERPAKPDKAIADRIKFLPALAKVLQA